MVKAIAAGGQLASLVAAMKEREQHRDQLVQQTAAVNQLRGVGHLDVKRIERDLRARVKEWRALLGRQVPMARRTVTKLLEGRLVVTAREDRTYEFSGRVSLGGLLQEMSYRVSGVPEGNGIHLHARWIGPQSGVRRKLASTTARCSYNAPDVRGVA